MTQHDRTPIQDLLNAIIREAIGADDRYGPMQSTHEGYGVLMEEIAELLEAIRRNDLLAVRIEAIQIAAVALRIAQAVEGEPFCRRSVK